MENIAYKVKEGSLEQFETIPVFAFKNALGVEVRVYISGRVEIDAGFCGPRAPARLEYAAVNNFLKFAKFLTDARIKET